MVVSLDFTKALTIFCLAVTLDVNINIVKVYCTRIQLNSKYSITKAVLLGGMRIL